MIRNVRSLLTFCGLALAWSGSASAGILLAAPINGTVGNGIATGSALTVAPNNYPVSASSNNLTTSVSLTTGTGPLDLIIAATNSGGVTQYTATASVINSTGAALTSYQFQFGSGTDGNFAPSSSLAFFTTPPTPSSPSFTTATETAGTLTFTGGSIAIGATASFTFGLAVRDVPGTVGTPFTFTLREGVASAAVPEPGSMLMTALGGLGVATARKLRRRRAA